VKGLLRSNGVQGALGFALWLYLDLVVRTIRWTRIDEQTMTDHIFADKAAIGCFWHEFVPLSISAKPTVKGRRTRVLISLSPDGEFVARAMARHDMPAIRGSSGKKSDRAKAKGGVAAFREALEFLANKGVLAIAPDGPRGPAREFALGVVQMAKRSQAGVFFMGLTAAPHKRLRTWDRMMLPRLFGRAVIVWDGPHYCPPDADDAAMKALAVEWGEKLSATTARAEAALS
jgi:lysophospholipid acyltransferase (LPLAT)-like uncharacterized protein